MAVLAQGSSETRRPADMDVERFVRVTVSMTA